MKSKVLESNWIMKVNRNLLPIFYPMVTGRIKSFNPAKISKQLGHLDFDNWTSVLSEFKVSLLIDAEQDTMVTAELEPDTKEITMVIKEISSACIFELLQGVMHELIHCNQFEVDDRYYNKALCKTGDEFIDYLGLQGEVQAFAHCLFLEYMSIGNIKLCTTYITYQETPLIVRKHLLKQFNRWRLKYGTIL